MKTAVTIEKPSNGTYAADMTFPTVVVKAGSSPISADNYSVVWTAGIGGTIDSSKKPTSAGDYTATVSLTASGDLKYKLPDTKTVTYTINKVTINDLTLANVPAQPVLGGTITNPIATQITAANTAIASHSWTGGTGVWKANNTPAIELTITPAANHSFKASGWATGDIKGTLNGATAKVTAQSATSLTVTLTWPQLKAAEVPVATGFTAVQDKTTTGGVTVSFNEPSDTSAISKYVITLTGGDAPITKDVVKTGNGSKHEVTLDLTEVEAGKTYTAKVTSVATDNVTHSNKDTANASVTVNKANVTVAAGTAIDVLVGYSSGNTTTVTVTNTGDVVAKNILLPALNGSFENQSTGTNWATTIATLAPKAHVTYDIQLVAGKTANTYDWNITGVTGDNLNTVADATVKAKVSNPAEIETVNFAVPAQPVIGGSISAPTVTVGSGEGAVTSATWSKAGTWADTDVPKITLTLTAPSGKVYASAVTLGDNQGDNAVVTATGAGTDTLTVTVTYKTLAAVPVSVTVSTPDALTYGGYNNGNVITVAVKNDGTENAKVSMSAIPSDSKFEAVNWPAGEQTIAKGATLNYTVRLKTDMTAATYEMDYTVTAGTGSKITSGDTGKVTQVVNVATATLSVDTTAVTGKANTVIKVYAKPMANGKLIEGVQDNLSATPSASVVIKSADVGAFEAGQGYPITITLEAFASSVTTPETVTVAMSAVGGKYSAPADTTITVTPTTLTTVSFDLSKTTATYNGAVQSVTFTGIKDSDTNASITLVEGTDYDIHYNDAITKPTDAGTYTVKMVLKNGKEGTYTPAVERIFTITQVEPVATLITTAVSTSGKKLGEYFSGMGSLSGNDFDVLGTENQFKLITGDVSNTAMTGTFSITGGSDFDTEVIQGASYSWTFTPTGDAATNYKAISGTVTPWAAAPTPPPSSGGGSGTSTYTVTYDAGEHGKITSGKSSESVAKGKLPANVPTVTANEGWSFLGWTLKGKDELVKPEETKITASTTFVAKYEESKKALGFNKDLTGSYMKGNEDGTFGPDRDITRGEVAVILSRILTVKMDASKTYATTFPDMDGTEWYAKEAAFLKELGIINGVEDGSFAGEQKITREEFVTMVMRIDGLIEGTNPFPDVSENNWGMKYIIAAAAKGYINGMEDGSFQPGQNITRASVVKIINGVLGLKGITGEMKFNDVPADHWAYAEILNATIGKQAAAEPNA